MAIYESGEDYLETILVLHNTTGFVRSIDIANKLGYSKPSISRAMSLLKEGGLIVMDKEGLITLTPAGHDIAAKIYERHTLLTEFLTRLGVDGQTAVADACKIEHDISDESFEAIKAHVNRQKSE